MQRDESKTDGSWRTRTAKGQAGNGGCRPLPSPGYNRPGVSGVTLIELLCVIVIIGILASLLLPTVARAYNRARAFSEEMEVSEVVGLLLAETRGYCESTRQFHFDNKPDFADKCGLAPKCKDWVQASTTEFIPFNHLDPTNKTVLVFHYGRNRVNSWAFDIGELSIRPQEH